MVTRRLFIPVSLERVPYTITYFEVDMRAGRFAGRADIADNLPLLYVLPGHHGNLGLVRVERLASVAVLNDNVVAIAGIPTATIGDEDVTFGSRDDGRACGCSEIYPVVSVDTLRLYVAGERNYVVGNLCRRTRL